MNTEYFIARRLFSGKGPESRYSKPVVTIAIIGIALGITVMMLAVAIVTGYKNKITDKVIGIGSHLQVVNFDTNVSFETKPISLHQDWIKEVEKLDEITNIQQFATKAGIIKTDDYLQGIVLKGVNYDYDWSFIQENLVEGEVLDIKPDARTNNVVLSKNIADILNLKVGDNIKTYFIQDPPRMRKFKLVGIYNSGLEDLDKLFLFTDIKHVQKLNNWNKDQITGYELSVKDYKKLLDTDLEVTSILAYRFTDDGSMLKVKNIIDSYPQIFDWLRLLDMNVWVILILVVLVAAFNMVSSLLVIILERVNMIGVLKSIGATNFSIRKVFIYYASFLTAKGIIIGNIIGILLCILQSQFGIITLDASTYYVDVVPINLNFVHIILLNIGTLIVTFAMMLIPSMLVSKLNPIDTINFD